MKSQTPPAVGGETIDHLDPHDFDTFSDLILKLCELRSEAPEYRLLVAALADNEKDDGWVVGDVYVLRGSLDVLLAAVDLEMTATT